MDALIKMTARQAVAALKKREVTPGELIDAAERRIAEVEPKINALPTLCLDRARAMAAKLTPPDPAPPGYLYGLPIATKDQVDVAGVRSTQGSRVFADYVPAKSGWSVERLESNGALIVAKSNTPEFGAGSQTFNDVFGTTTNPWNTATTPAGSSGGAAACLAAGEVWLADGSDLGGSLRIPASFTGVVGLRPSPGRVAFGPRPFQRLKGRVLNRVWLRDLPRLELDLDGSRSETGDWPPRSIGFNPVRRQFPRGRVSEQGLECRHDLSKGRLLLRRPDPIAPLDPSRKRALREVRAADQGHASPVISVE